MTRLAFAATLLLASEMGFAQTPPAPSVQAAIHVVSPALFANAPVKPQFPIQVFMWMQVQNPAPGITYDFKVTVRTAQNSTAGYVYYVGVDAAFPWSSIVAQLPTGDSFQSATVALMTEGTPVAVTTVQ